MSSSSAEDEKKVKPVPDPRSPGSSKRMVRVERALATFREQVRVEYVNEGRDADADEIEVEAFARLTELLGRQDPEVAKQLAKTAPSSVSPPRDGLYHALEVGAMRRTPMGRNLEAVLRAQTMGRPTDRRLPLAIFEEMALGMGRPSVREHLQRFLQSDGLLDHVHEHPVTDANCGISESSVRATLKKMLNRNDPDLAIALNIEGIKQLAQRHGDIGRYVAIDGTDVPAWLDQGPDWGRGHAALMNRRVEGAEHGSHGKNYFWRGYVLIVLTDIKSTLPLAWVLASAKGDEASLAREVIDLLYRHWPECPIEYLVGDRGFDVPAALHRDLEELYGIHLVTPWKRSADEVDAERGIPHCHCTGAPEPMTYRQSDGFWPAAKRRDAGIDPGERIDLKKTKARHRWSCAHCGNRENRWFWQDPRRHCFLPRGGIDPWRVALRAALLVRRNAAEGMFATLKHRGIAGKEVNVPRWVTSQRQMSWLIGTCLLGVTLRRVAHETGIYEQVREEAEAEQLLKLRGAFGRGRAALAA